MDLYDYQKEGVRFLMGRKRAYLADEMGLGKTVQAIKAAEALDVKSVLVVCPASAVLNWHREWKTWYRGKRGYLAVVSYSRLIRSWREIDGGDWDLVILDEAHYCKTPSAKRTIRALNIAKKAGRAWLLSGTPIPNNPSELWPIMKHLWPEIPAVFGIRNAFGWFDRFCLWTTTQYGPRPYGVKNADQLRRRLTTFMLRRRLDQIALDLPPLRVDVHRLEKDASLQAALQKFGDVRDLEALMELEQKEGGSVSRLRRLLGEYKTPRIAELIVEELGCGAYPRIVVLAHHRNSLARLAQYFKEKGVRYVGFHGGTSLTQRQAAIDAFQGGGEQVFLAQQTAAGIAINLQCASEIVLVEPSWVPSENTQAIKRIHRIGQDSPCRARIFSVIGTLDDPLMEIVAQKSRMITEILGGE